MEQRTKVIIEREVPCELRDGVTLYANVYRPEENGRFPVLLSRLPYNKNMPHFSHRYVDPVALALEGYAVIIQDVRGRFSSEGEFEPFVQELDDGYDAVEWAAVLPYSDGNVGMFGLSYYGFTQMYAAMTKPPSLKAIFPAFTGHDAAMAERNGALQVSKLQTWLLDSVAPDFLRRRQEETVFQETMREIIIDLDNIFESYASKPVNQWYPLMKHTDIQPLFENMLNGALAASLNEHPGSIMDISVPGCHMAGWYDCFLAGTLDNYQKMKANGQALQKLIIGPWGHGTFTPFFGDRYFGMTSSGGFIDGKDDVTSLHISWFDRWLKGKEPEADGAPVKLFVMGINEWREEQEWPLARTEYKRYYLHSDGKANKGTENGMLSDTLPGIGESSDTYVYDPEKPVPTVGGATLFFQGVNTGPLKQNETEEREDVIVYSSGPLKKPVEITGPVKVELFASTDVPDTDFTAKLADVDPDGSSIILCEGIVRAGAFVGGDAEAAARLADGDAVKYGIDLWATSNVFMAGHRIRVEISSSNVPKYAPNLNTGRSVIDSSESQAAKQTVYHDALRPSCIILPVIAS